MDAGTRGAAGGVHDQGLTVQNAQGIRCSTARRVGGDGEGVDGDTLVQQGLGVGGVQCPVDEHPVAIAASVVGYRSPPLRGVAPVSGAAAPVTVDHGGRSRATEQGGVQNSDFTDGTQAFLVLPECSLGVQHLQKSPEKVCRTATRRCAKTGLSGSV